MSKKLHVKTGDTVIVISGKSSYKNVKNVKADDDKKDKAEKNKAIGKVIATSPEEGKVIVEGVNIVHKHVKPRRQGEAGGIVNTEGAIYANKVMLYCPKCEAGRRVRHKKLETGEKVRACVKCGEIL